MWLPLYNFSPTNEGCWMQTVETIGGSQNLPVCRPHEKKDIKFGRFSWSAALKSKKNKYQRSVDIQGYNIFDKAISFKKATDPTYSAD